MIRWTLALAITAFFSLIVSQRGIADSRNERKLTIPDTLDIAQYIDRESAGWAYKKRDEAFRAQVKDCTIQWNAVEYQQNDLPNSLSVRIHCPYPFRSQAPIHKAILAKVFESWDKNKFDSLSWGSFGNRSAKDWSWNVPVAFAASTSIRWQKALADYPHGGSSNAIFVELANETDAFRDLRLLFNEFGLGLRLASVEKVFVSRAKELPFYKELIALGLKGNPKLMYDVGMSYFSIKKRPNN